MLAPSSEWRNFSLLAALYKRGYSARSVDDEFHPEKTRDWTADPRSEHIGLLCEI